MLASHFSTTTATAPSQPATAAATVQSVFSSLGGSNGGVYVPVPSVAVSPFSGPTMPSAVGYSHVHPVGVQAFSGLQHQLCPSTVRQNVQSTFSVDEHRRDMLWLNVEVFDDDLAMLLFTMGSDDGPVSNANISCMEVDSVLGESTASLVSLGIQEPESVLVTKPLCTQANESKFGLEEIAPAGEGNIIFSLNDINQKKGMGKFAVDELEGISTPVIDGQLQFLGWTNMLRGGVFGVLVLIFFGATATSTCYCRTSERNGNKCATATLLCFCRNSERNGSQCTMLYAENDELGFASTGYIYWREAGGDFEISVAFLCWIIDSPQSVVSPFKTSVISEPEKHKIDYSVQSSVNLPNGIDVSRKEAEDIHNICIYHKQDVYAKLCLTSDPQSTVSTKIINDGGRNPVFNDQLQLNVRTIDYSLKCEIFMMSRVKNYLEDQLLGFALVPLSEVLMKNGNLEKESSLSSTDLFHSPAGFVQLSLSYAGASPEVIAIPATALAADGNTQNADSVPCELDKIEFRDPKIVNEDQMMVSEYIVISCSNLDSESCDSLAASDAGNCPSEVGVNVVESFSAATVDSAHVPKLDSSPSSVSTN
ncbi:hypothetical protein Tsubulata_031267 [Turnera subulata]|uniref:C2 domain-containing protein n=1 Tax=Turnera subulata TaxID=218843 RepID=A0A9Q0GAM2_9ROSI|nr:hypothetical protein Tsubulata_031267 [Turnera subulata]